ncbi:MAG: polyphosphate kinase 2 [Candidatus Gracilibacteria bacterium]|nr:polyphosphate kinase 2 [Candidatus Gracilibacteria bacterium]
MPAIFYEIFNKQIILNSKTIDDFKKAIKTLFKELKNEHDIDNLRVLRNRLESLLEDKSKHGNKKTKKTLVPLFDILEEIDDCLDHIDDERKQKTVLVDVVKKVENRYKACKNISKDKRDKYTETCIKKSTIEYEKELIKLQVELLKLQKHIKENNEKVLIIFEGRDAAGKGGTIKRFKEYLNPRGSRIVALEKPSDIEKTQWYFQRYINHLPAGGEMTFFDRSWYNRAGVEPVMGFVNRSNYQQFLDDVPKFEKMLTKSGVKIVKFYFSVGKDEQAKRFDSRKTNPLKQFKLSPIDQFSQQLWHKYTLAEYHNFTNTHSDHAPWTIINSDDKKKARINAIKHVLNQFDYEGKISKKELKVDDEIVYSGKEKAKRLKKEIDIKKDLFEH